MPAATATAMIAAVTAMTVMPEIAVTAAMVSVVPPGPEDATGQIRCHDRYE